jgi:hypothetical protein
VGFADAALLFAPDTSFVEEAGVEETEGVEGVEGVEGALF